MLTGEAPEVELTSSVGGFCLFFGGVGGFLGETGSLKGFVFGVLGFDLAGESLGLVGC